MPSYYKLSIPKPCHENWQEMTPNEKGRFCQSCSKTVVDFTKMNTAQVQEYIHQNKHPGICGHIKQSQLDTINIQISEYVFDENLNFHKLFLLVLLIVMGSTIFSCKDENGITKKIESVELVKNLQDSLNVNPLQKNDSVKITKSTHCPIKVEKRKPSIPVITGEVVEVVGIMVPESLGEPFSFFQVDIPPKFKNSSEVNPMEDIKKQFQKHLTKFISKEFDTLLGKKAKLSGRQRIYSQFEIDKDGKVTNIKIRAPHTELEKETFRVLKLLPQFIPAKHEGKHVSTVYSLPIMLKI